MIDFGVDRGAENAGMPQHLPDLGQTGARAQQLLAAVDVAQYAVEQVGALHDAGLDLRPFGGREHQRQRVDLLVLVNAMIPRPGETGADWWSNTKSKEAELASEAAGGAALGDFTVKVKGPAEGQGRHQRPESDRAEEVMPNRRDDPRAMSE